MHRDELASYLDELLEVSLYKDYAPNGLQVEGQKEVKKIVTGVTACQALIDRAIECGADTIMVHHGYFWKSEPQQIVGFKQKRIKSLLTHDINLFGYHLPLDGHIELGNNAQLGQLWDLPVTDQDGLVFCSRLETPIAVEAFYQTVKQTLGREPLWLKGGPEQLQTIAWCSGGAQNYIDKAIAMGADLFISGEVSEQTTHLAAECGIHYFAAGHHATERLGIQVLGEHLQDKFGLDVTFIDIPNPV
ncbi:Nif3-like dinuclear metal center hexameric protein [Thiomicrorhabdus sp. 6S3-12]|uniref:Nif3-like dinuclear metal center hexameric protein n=1 Tax=Thiomicrorhabdus sp. 6S3-12 TaxID=2819681 RepID=UPI001AAD2ECD|nr:Nif3-like dinuclear metal center hexameric protein [Thiomicrorhabdus sp. 6S3-12]MBO1922951.1 Nif3-like dinuclear metal center hexameric protein [Thiomicrorhabdus sp. 6S3-12]